MPTLEKYSLRGVCVDPATTFVLIPFLKPGGVSVDGAPSSSAGSPTEQWWCLRWGPPKSNIGWSETPIANYGVNKVTEEEVFEAIKTTGNGSLFVVYANENALNPEGGIDTSLPGPLQVCWMRLYWELSRVLMRYIRLLLIGIMRHSKQRYSLLHLEEKGITTGSRTTTRP